MPVSYERGNKLQGPKITWNFLTSYIALRFLRQIFLHRFNEVCSIYCSNEDAQSSDRDMDYYVIISYLRDSNFILGVRRPVEIKKQ